MTHYQNCSSRFNLTGRRQEFVTKIGTKTSVYIIDSRVVVELSYEYTFSILQIIIQLTRYTHHTMDNIVHVHYIIHDHTILCQLVYVVTLQAMIMI